MTRKHVRRTLLTLAACLCAAPAIPAPKKSAPPPDPALPAVEKVLRAEVAGAVDRRDKLADTLASHPDSPAARWQAGYVREEGGWRSFDEPFSESRVSESREEYLARRSETPQTYQGQLELANWCRQHKLGDQERAHLWAALGLNGDQDRSELMQRLGLVQIENQWLTREQLANWQKQIRTALDSIKRFGPRLEKIAQQLRGSGRQREIGMQQLKQLKDPAVIPAIECLLCGEEMTAQAGITALTRFSESASTLALARQAAFSSWNSVRKEGCLALKSRRFEDFVPGLIGLLSLPATMEASSRWYYLQDRPGHEGWGGFILVQSYVIALETEDQFRVELMHVLDNRITELLAFAGGTVSLDYGPNAQTRSIIRMVQDDNLLAAHARQYALERELDAANDRSGQLNRRIIHVLAAVSGRDPSPDVQAWWQWWGDFTDTMRSGDKTAVVRVDETTIGDPTAVFHRLTCFAAGTPVWTDRGRAAIETIQVGDRVLSQDVETGELTYKPVIKTTVRPPKGLTTLRIGDEVITCTGGHRFWVAIEGWTKARDLKPQALLHTVTGNVAVSSSQAREAAQTYNLVIADFHTYFVGGPGVLCQDLLIPSGSESLVPGLPRARAAAGGKK